MRGVVMSERIAQIMMQLDDETETDVREVLAEIRERLFCIEENLDWVIDEIIRHGETVH